MASDDVLGRKEVASHIGTLSNKALWTGADEEAAEALEAHDAALRARIEELEEALEGMMDGTDCRLDHHGLCQAHGWNDDGDCPERRARRALESDHGDTDGE